MDIEDWVIVALVLSPFAWPLWAIQIGPMLKKRQIKRRVQVLHTGSPPQRRGAIYGLARENDPKYLPLLWIALSDASSEVRLAAARALWRWGNPLDAEALRSAVDGRDDEVHLEVLLDAMPKNIDKAHARTRYERLRAFSPDEALTELRHLHYFLDWIAVDTLIEIACNHANGSFTRHRALGILRDMFSMRKDDYYHYRGKNLNYEDKDVIEKRSAVAEYIIPAVASRASDDDTDVRTAAKDLLRWLVNYHNDEDKIDDLISHSHHGERMIWRTNSNNHFVTADSASVSQQAEEITTPGSMQDSIQGSLRASPDVLASRVVQSMASDGADAVRIVCFDSGQEVHRFAETMESAKSAGDIPSTVHIVKIVFSGGTPLEEMIEYGINEIKDSTSTIVAVTDYDRLFATKVLCELDRSKVSLFGYEAEPSERGERAASTL